MKKLTIVLYLLFFFCTTICAQRYVDMNLRLIAPLNNAWIDNTQPITLQYAIKNLGADTLHKTDTIKIQWTMDGSVVMMSNAGSLDSFIRHTSLLLAPNDSFVFTSPPVIFANALNGDANLCLNLSLKSSINTLNFALDTLLNNNTQCALLHIYPLLLTEENTNNTPLVYPNPTLDYVNLSSILNEKSVSAIYIFNMKGQLLKQFDFFENVIDFSNYLPGNYLMKIIYENRVFCRTIFKI